MIELQPLTTFYPKADFQFLTYCHPRSMPWR